MGWCFNPEASSMFFFPLLLAYHTCPLTSFTCANGRCVQYRYRCDHYNDCGDNSDEAGCLFRACNETTEFTCSNGKCIPLHLVCDGMDHCHDHNASDEKNCCKFIFSTCALESWSLRAWEMKFLYKDNAFSEKKPHSIHLKHTFHFNTVY